MDPNPSNMTTRHKRSPLSGGCYWFTQIPPLQYSTSESVDRYKRRDLRALCETFQRSGWHSFTFMDDHTCSLRTRVVNEYLKTKAIQRMECPTRSPNLKPIEYV
ncbi:hypothetical protein TNCV_4599301 [Trichonephila clavipes]|nr:hypothetical protein TNCV_4599301 [Trichonephila clavipes]